MGAAASIKKDGGNISSSSPISTIVFPDKLYKDKVKELAGDYWDESVFDKFAKANHNDIGQEDG